MRVGLIAVVCFVVSASNGWAGQPAGDKTRSVEPEVEWRGTWVQSHDIDTREKCDHVLEVAARANLNAIMTYGPWPMVQYMAEKSVREKLGIEFHGWVVNVTAKPPKQEWQLVDPQGRVCAWRFPFCWARRHPTRQVVRRPPWPR